ncbi:MAG: CsgG/HfaB family protein [Polyangiaceae bacterium]
MSRLTVSGLALAISLAGCASAPPTLSQQELQSAQQNGSLEALYDQYAAKLAGQKLNTPEGQKAQQQLNELGAQLGGKLEQEIRSELNQQATASGLVPLPVIDAQITKLPKLQKWSPEKYSKLAAELNELKGRTQARITAQQNQLAKFTENEMGQRLSVLDDLAKLTGDDRYSRERADVLANLRKKADDALKNEQYGEAKQALSALKQADPEDKAVGTQLTLADARIFEKKFWDSLAEGQLDSAYTQFMNLSQTAEFPEILKRLSKSSDDMVAYFVAQAGTATSENKLGEAYKLLGQARDIRTKSNASATRPPQEEAFLKAVFTRYQTAIKDGQTGLALGYLKVIEGFNPEFPGLRANLRTTQETTLVRATKKVSTAAFTDAAGGAEFGGAVAAKVTQHLFDKIPNDIKLIERDQFQAILREKEIGAASQPNELSTADYLIQGKILESRVDTTENRSKKTMRVVTETVTVSNPAYEQWSALSEAQKAKQPAPARTLAQEKKEDVTINLQIMRKVGIISASFRLVEAQSGKVLATGSDSSKAEYTDEGNEGIELGQFRMPFKLASLPADSEILQKLTDNISEVIGDKLVKELKDPEVRYADAARRYADEGDTVMAAENQAYAFALASLKKEDTAALRRQLEQYSVKVP